MPCLPRSVENSRMTAFSSTIGKQVATFEEKSILERPKTLISSQKPRNRDFIVVNSTEGP